MIKKSIKEEFFNLPNTITMVRISLLPVSLILYLVLFLYLARVCPPPAPRSDLVRYVRDELAKLGRWSRGELNTVLAFAVAVLL